MLRFSAWKATFILGVCIVALIVALPNFFKDNGTGEPLSWLPSKKTMNLGLDLRGGSHLLLEVDFNAYLKDQLEQLADDIRSRLRKEKINYANLSAHGEGVTLSFRNLADREKAKNALDDLSRDLNISFDETGIGRLTYREPTLKDMRRKVLEQSIEIVRRRVDETGTREPSIQRQGDARILLQVPGLQEPERLKQLLGRTAKLTFHLMDKDTPYPGGPMRPPVGTMLLTGTEDGQTHYYLIQRRVMLGGEMLVHAQAGFDRGMPVVFFRFNSIGAKKFGTITKENVGKPFAIVLDGKVISAPRINEPILGGSGMISGGFTVQEANDLGLLLRAGALPAPLNVVEERTVGPSLGQDSIDSGTIAALVGVSLVILFMLLFYGLFGIFANIAMIINLMLLVALLSLIEATLTLPGIAGIALTLGMAVDANVLIFERMREETRMGKTPFAAVESGFHQAFRTIMDSNITTLIAAVLLFVYGSGPVKGFAVTLSAGIVTSMFTAIVLTRLMITVWIRRFRPTCLPL